MDNINRSPNNFRLPIDSDETNNEVLQARVQLWDTFFIKYSMETNNGREFNLKTLRPETDERNYVCEQRLPMRNPLSSVQYWVNTGKPPCLSVADENYNSPEEASFSEEEISAFHPAAISPFEHNSPHSPQPAIIPSEPTKPSTSIVSSDSVNTRIYILSSNLAKKNMSSTIVENGKLTDITARNNNIDEADVYVDVCGTDEMTKISNENRERTFHSQSTTILDNSKIKNDLSSTQASTLLRVPTGSLKIQDVIPSLRQIPEIYASDASSQISTSSENLKSLFTAKIKTPIVNKSYRRKLFTNSQSPVEFPEYQSPKQILSRRSSSSFSNILHPAFTTSPVRLISRKRKSYYKRRLSTYDEGNETVASKSLPPSNQEKLKPCSVVIEPLRLSNLQKKRKSDGENCDDEVKSKKMKFSTDRKSPTKISKISENQTSKNVKKNQLPEENEINQGKPIDLNLTNLSNSLTIKSCSIILEPIDSEIVKDKIADQTKLRETETNKFVSQHQKTGQDKINSDSSRSTRNSFEIPRRDVSFLRVRRTLSFGQSDSDDSEKLKKENTNKNKDDEDFDMRDNFDVTKNNAGSKVNEEEKKNGNVGNVAGENSLFRELSYYVNDEEETTKPTLNTQFNAISSRRFTRFHIVSSSEVSSISSENKIPLKKKISKAREKREKGKQPKNGKNSTSSSSKVSEDEKLKNHGISKGTRKSGHQVPDKKSGLENVSVSTPKKKLTPKKETPKKTKKQLNSKQTKKEGNSKKLNFLSDSEKSENIDRRKSPRNINDSKFVDFFTSEEENSEDENIFQFFRKRNSSHFNKNNSFESELLQKKKIQKSGKKNLTKKRNSNVKILDDDEVLKLNTEVAGKSNYRAPDNKDSENISDSTPKKNRTLKKENLNGTKKQINSTPTKKEENSKERNFISDNENKVRRKLTPNKRDSFKLKNLFASDEEDSEDDIFDLNLKKNLNENTYQGKKSGHASDNKKSEFEKIFDLTPKRNLTLKEDNRNTTLNAQLQQNTRRYTRFHIVSSSDVSSSEDEVSQKKKIPKKQMKRKNAKQPKKANSLKKENSNLKISDKDETMKLNIQFDENSKIAEKSCSSPDNAKIEFVKLLELSPKKHNEQNLISENEIVIRKSRRNKENSSKFINFFESGEEDSEDVFDFKSKSKTVGDKNETRMSSNSQGKGSKKKKIQEIVNDSESSDDEVCFKSSPKRKAEKIVDKNKNSKKSPVSKKKSSKETKIKDSKKGSKKKEIQESFNDSESSEDEVFFKSSPKRKAEKIVDKNKDSKKSPVSKKKSSKETKMKDSKKGSKKKEIQESFSDSESSEDEVFFKSSPKRKAKKIVDKNKDSKKSPVSKKKSLKENKIEDNVNHSNFNSSSEDEDIFVLKPNINRSKIVKKDKKIQKSVNDSESSDDEVFFKSSPKRKAEKIVDKNKDSKKSPVSKKKSLKEKKTKDSKKGSKKKEIQESFSDSESSEDEVFFKISPKRKIQKIVDKNKDSKKSPVSKKNSSKEKKIQDSKKGSKKKEIQESFSDSESSDDEVFFKISPKRKAVKIVDKSKDNTKFSPVSKKKSLKEKKIEDIVNHSNFNSNSEDEDIFVLKPNINRSKIVEKDKGKKILANSKEQLFKNKERKSNLRRLNQTSYCEDSDDSMFNFRSKSNKTVT